MPTRKAQSEILLKVAAIVIIGIAIAIGAMMVSKTVSASANWTDWFLVCVKEFPWGCID